MPAPTRLFRIDNGNGAVINGETLPRATATTLNALSDEWRFDYSTTDTVRMRAAIRTSTTSFERG